jgi:hypothetical protein
LEEPDILRVLTFVALAQFGSLPRSTPADLTDLSLKVEAGFAGEIQCFMDIHEFAVGIWSASDAENLPVSRWIVLKLVFRFHGLE